MQEPESQTFLHSALHEVTGTGNSFLQAVPSLTNASCTGTDASRSDTEISPRKQTGREHQSQATQAIVTSQQFFSMSRRKAELIAKKKKKW
jgi:hypothetical protein